MPADTDSMLMRCTLSRDKARDNSYLQYAAAKCIRRNKEILKKTELGYLSAFHDSWDQNLEFPDISYEDLTSATNGFHETNMLGKGSFGKGTLEDGMEVAVKWLNKDSEQGVEQFRNEVVLIAKLQHKNLVRLLGCCIHGDEKLLIYEYLPNKSLDKFLFDHAMKSVIDWPTRFNIIKGVARGLLYLHQDSRMMIIHRDLKTSNILLDAEMNPKISDFGMARIFGNSEQQASTNRVVGTYGYMAPEYAMEGIFSVKSDTYSFGVLLLEIVSGLKISSPHYIVMDFPNLIAYAWNLWKDGMAEAFVDKMVLDSCLLNEVLQCIHIGLLCVQDSPNARPHMSLVVSMLDNEDMARPIPKQPIYFVQRHYDEEERQGSEIFISLLFLISSCKGDDQLTQANRLISPGDVLVSKGKVFALGFFSPTASNQSFFLGIWYHNISESERTYVWVANRDNPITTPSSSSSATLAISNSSNLTTNVTATGGDGAYAALLDSGNLVLLLPNGTTIWQSFDHPTDTLLMGMRFLVSYKAQVAMRFIAWKGPDDPSTGDFSASGDPSSNLQVFLWNGTRPYVRFIGPNNMWSSVFPYSSSLIYETSVSTDDEFYVRYTTSDGSSYKRLQLDYTGTLKFLAWNNSSSSWTVVFQRPAPAVECDPYASCGPFGYCDATAAIPRCQCLDGFEPDGSNSSSRGCRRKQQLRCGDRDDRFVTMAGMKIPDKFLHVRNRSFDECAAECSRNCSCTAYAYANLTGADQARCLIWSGELADTGRANIGENLYLRLADSTVNKKKSDILKIVLPVITSLLILMCICLAWICKSRELPFICLEDIVTATNNFSDHNMLGKGGFGKVYKGVLEGGKEVAIKRLSKGSQQGVEEFRNEVVLIAKLQHRNLVRLISYCLHEDEKLLIYEYLPNKSLDTFLFDATRKSVLDWTTRFMIIKGIARGLLYLHQDSRLTIIHRDLKASNILLDTNMSPKISDFGMARIFEGNKQQENTTRVVGTYGYMSPEYALEGSFSVKSDTYSFGVLLLELAWSLWKDGNAMDLVDSSIRESCLLHKVLRCIQIALSCLQDDPTARPLMSSIVFMLENETASLPTPKEPAYFTARLYGTKDTRENKERSVNNVSITALEGPPPDGKEPRRLRRCRIQDSPTDRSCKLSSTRRQIRFHPAAAAATATARAISDESEVGWM
uniref:non-specific serine/threonine protein kinase n=1 Tax=Oryza glumipatula TaxID=40148 RepID=A0A0D9ZR79_9ORYZ